MQSTRPYRCYMNMHTCTYAHVTCHMHMHMHMDMHMCMHVCMHVCTCA
jgi:hypothetical protein